MKTHHYILIALLCIGLLATGFALSMIFFDSLPAKSTSTVAPPGSQKPEASRNAESVKSTKPSVKPIQPPTEIDIEQLLYKLEKEWEATRSKTKEPDAKELATRVAALNRLLNQYGKLDPTRLRGFAKRHVQVEHISRKEWIEIMRHLGKREQIVTMDWISTVFFEQEELGNPVGFWTFVDSWILVDAQSAANWVDGNQDHPLRDFVVWKYSLKLKSQNPQAAQTLMGTIRNEKRKTLALQELSKAK